MSQATRDAEDIKSMNLFLTDDGTREGGKKGELAWRIIPISSMVVSGSRKRWDR